LPIGPRSSRQTRLGLLGRIQRAATDRCGFGQHQGRKLVGDDDREVRRCEFHRPYLLRCPYFLAPEGEAGRDVYAVLRGRRGDWRVALARVVIGQRERTIGIRAVEGGLVVHTLDERRDINDARSVFGNAAEMTPDPEMVALAKQLIDRQTSRYDPSDLEDHYEIRLRAMIDAKLKGAGIEAGAEPAPDCSNVVDLMAALKKSLGELQPSQSVNRRSLRLTRQRQNRSVLRLRRPSHRAS
jgi:non-homologous end joining protein Ku